MHPYKDDKILTDWNGLMIASMAKGYKILKEEKYLKAANAAAHFIQKNLYKNKKLLRRYRDGESHFDGSLDDYAYAIFGLIALYEASQDRAWLTWALELQSMQDHLFWDETEGGYFYTSEGDPSLIRRSKEFHDEARPNSNAIAACNLLNLHRKTLEKWCFREYLK